MFNFLQKKSKGEEITFKIGGMHCTSCAMNIDGALEEIDGVHSATTSYAKAVVKVEYDAAKVTKEQLMKTIAEQGYTPNSQ